MSDPMTNMGADDVLASIRRLVSETYDPQVRKKNAAATPERFVLSPDLRVIEGSSAPYSSAQDDPIPSEDAVASQDDAPFILEPQNATHIPSVTAEASSAATTECDDEAFQEATPLAHADDEFETQTEYEPNFIAIDDAVEDVDEVIEAPRATTPVEDAVHAAQVLMRDDASEAHEPEWSAQFDDTPYADAVDHAAGLSLEERIAELETAVESQSQGLDSDEYDDDDDNAPQVFPQALVNSSARVLNFRSADFEKMADAAEIKVQAERLDDADLDDVLTVPEAPQEADVETVELVSGITADEPTPMDQFEIKEESVDRDPSIPPLQDVIDDLDDEDEDLALAGYADDEVLDEQVLRDMIATVIREELQGALGERITSNVRRLVRREVQRALTLREFD